MFAFSSAILMTASLALSAMAQGPRTGYGVGAADLEVDVRVLPEDTAVREVILNIDALIPPTTDQMVRLADNWRGDDDDTSIEAEFRADAESIVRQMGLDPNDTIVSLIVERKQRYRQIDEYMKKGYLSLDKDGFYTVTVMDTNVPLASIVQITSTLARMDRNLREAMMSEIRKQVIAARLE